MLRGSCVPGPVGPDHGADPGEAAAVEAAGVVVPAADVIGPEQD